MEPFKNELSADKARLIAAAVKRAHPAFPMPRFTRGLDAALDRPAEMTRLFGATSDSPTLKGFGLKLDAFADGLVASGGTLSTRTASLRSAIQRNEKEMDKVVDRASRAEARYLAQYNAMDAAVSRMNSLNAYVAQQVTLWNKSSG